MRGPAAGGPDAGRRAGVGRSPDPCGGPTFRGGGRGGRNRGRDGAGRRYMIPPPRQLRTARSTLTLGGRPWVMGVVNASPESFSDAGGLGTDDERVALARSLLAAGADLIDVGGESGVTNRPAVSPHEEAARVVPLIERLVEEESALVSVDTYKPQVARAAIAAGAAIVNDVSGLRDPRLADVCAETGAALVVTHTR